MGCGLPTTSQYKHIWEDEINKYNYEVHAFFQHDGVGIAHEIIDNRSFTFLGFAYAYSTSLCFLSKKIHMLMILWELSL